MTVSPTARRCRRPRHDAAPPVEGHSCGRAADWRSVPGRGSDDARRSRQPACKGPAKAYPHRFPAKQRASKARFCSIRPLVLSFMGLFYHRCDGGADRGATGRCCRDRDRGLGRQPPVARRNQTVRNGRVPGHRRRDCHFDDTPFLSLLKHLLKVEGGAAE